MSSTTPRQAPPLFSPAPAPRGRNLTAISLIALGVICAIALALQLYHFWPYMTDDAYISLRYSQRLLEGHGLTWNNLPPAVEGYTNLLWVLLCAGLGALGMHLVAAAHLLGIVSTAAGIAAVAAQVYRDYPAKIKFISALIGCLALCFSAPIGVWAIGGLEQPLLAAFLAWAAYFAIRWVTAAKPGARDANVAGVLLALALLTRADAALFTALFYAGAVFADGIRLRSFISRSRLLLIPVLTFFGQELFRHFYYGQWLPNTAYVKVAFTLHRLHTGLRYDISGFGSEIVFLLLAIIGAVALWIAGKKRQVILIATIAIGWLLYILAVGGDIFPAYRHFVPAMVLMAFLVAGCGMLTLAAPFRFSRARVAFFLVLTLLVLTSDLFAPLESWELEGQQIGLFLHQAFGDRHPLLSADAAGSVPFFAEMESLDPLGLNDYHIARHPVAGAGRGFIGHERADGKYVLDHKPDIILFADFQGDPLFLADQQVLNDPRFASRYQRIRIDTRATSPTHAVIYIRRTDGKVGIEQTGNHVTVPSYLASIEDSNSVRLIDGRARLVIAPHGSARFSAIPLAAGTWKATLTGPDVLRLTLQSSPAESSCATCTGPDAAGLTQITVLNPGDTPAVLSDIELQQQ